jgi:hypothetical protein
LSNTTKLVKAQDATLTMNWGAVQNPVGTVGYITITGFIKGYSYLN